MAFQLLTDKQKPWICNKACLTDKEKAFLGLQSILLTTALLKSVSSGIALHKSKKITNY